ENPEAKSTSDEGTPAYGGELLNHPPTLSGLSPERVRASPTRDDDHTGDTERHGLTSNRGQIEAVQQTFGIARSFGAQVRVILDLAKRIQDFLGLVPILGVRIGGVHVGHLHVTSCLPDHPFEDRRKARATLAGGDPQNKTFGT